MDAAFALEVLDKAPYVTVSMTRPDGTPYGLPLSLARTDERTFYIFNGECSEPVNKEFSESDVLDALIVAADNKRSHRDDILLIVVLDFLQTSELALAGFI